MRKCVIFIEDGAVQDVLLDSKERMDIVIVDFDKQTLDKSVVELLEKPYVFGDFAALADLFSWDAVYDPKRVQEIFQERAKLYGTTRE